MPALPAEKVSLFFLVEPAFICISYISHCFSMSLFLSIFLSFITVVVFFPQFYDVLPLLPASFALPSATWAARSGWRRARPSITGDVAGISCGLHTYDNALYIYIYYNHNHIYIYTIYDYIEGVRDHICIYNYIYMYMYMYNIYIYVYMYTCSGHMIYTGYTANDITGWLFWVYHLSSSFLVQYIPRFPTSSSAMGPYLIAGGYNNMANNVWPMISMITAWRILPGTCIIFCI